jgi:general stress protein 26
MTDTAPDHVWDLIEKSHAALLITKDGEKIDARPMATMVRRNEGRIYILANAGEDSDREIRADQDVVLNFRDGETYVTIYGSAAASNDRGKIRDLWNAFDKAWWDGPDDPRIRLLTVTPASAEYWESPGKMIAYAKMLAAAATGTRPDVGENKVVSLQN